jgi:tripartite-type tricarboxylate transporter receptor subunit TctC
VLQRPEVKSAFQAQGFDAGGGTPEEFAALIRSDIQKSREIITTAGIKVE